MEKWAAIIIGLTVLVLLENIVSEKQKKYVGLIITVIIWFLTGFRSEIGWDYDSYKNNFFTVEFDIDNMAVEPGYAITAEILRNLGFDYQMIFVVFATINYVFIWKGITFFRTIDKNIQYGFASYLFFVAPIIGMLNGFSVLRQMAAVSILFWGSQYIYKSRFIKYCLCVILATIFHYTAILMLPVYFLVRKNYNVSIYLVAYLLAIYFNQSGYLISMISNFIPLDTKYMAYFSGDDGGKLGLLFYFFIAIVIVALIVSFKDNISLNMIILGTIATITFIDILPLLRIRLYMISMIILFYQQLINIFNKKLKINTIVLFIIPLIIFFFHDLYIADYNHNYKALVFPYQSAGNIDYEFNFKLLK